MIVEGRVTAVRAVLRVGRDTITVGWLLSSGGFPDCPCRRCPHVEQALNSVTEDRP